MERKFTDDAAARAHLEELLWPDGPVCPHCGTVDQATLMQGKSHRPGLYNCRACDLPFTVTIGTVFERSKIPLHKWVYAAHLMASSKKGISALQLQRMLQLGSYRTAWFMEMRLREAMREDHKGTLGGGGGIVEADETYHGKVAKPRTRRTSGEKFGRSKSGRGPANKRAVVALVERGGRARLFHVGTADKKTVAKIVRENVAPDTRLHTDESALYRGADERFATHETVKHSAGEYARGDVHVNSAEGFFGVFKKGMTGVYQHCGEKYLARYLDEFSFRHNTRVKLGYNDGDRAALAVKGAAGKRLTLHRPKGSVPAGAPA
jgi:transposase-like protein